MRVAFVEWPEGLQAGGAEWREICDRLTDLRAELLVTNELPFGPWIAAQKIFNPEIAQQNVAIHEASLEALKQIGISAILS